MSRIMCGCKDDECKIGFNIAMEEEGYTIWMYGPNGEEFYMPLTPDKICAAMRDLKIALRWYTEPEEDKEDGSQNSDW